MKPEIKSQWVDALRSGEYDQGASYLRRASLDGPDKFCCLGVLTDLAVKSCEIGAVWHEKDGTYFILGHDGFLPEVVMEWAGLETSDPEVRPKSIYSTLSALNDANYTFAQIADIIEEEL